MQFNSANKNNRNNSRPGFRQNSSDSRSYSKKPNFRQGKPFGSDDNNDDQPRRNSNNSGEKRGYNRYGKNENGNSRFDSGKSFKSGSRSTSQRHASDNNEQSSRKDGFRSKFQKKSETGYQKRNYSRSHESDDYNKSYFKDDDGVRLNRYIANAGVCSRRDAEQYITAGVITINGKIVTELATKVHYGDVVKFNNAPLMPERKTYILLNKPKDYVTTTDDPHAEKTVMDLIGDAGKNRVYPVGRLDRATTGLLLLTNDGDLAEHLCHPRYNKQKIYQVTLDRKMSPEDIEKMLSGIELEDGMANADEIEYCNPDDKSEVGVVIHSGRNRIVRRMFEALKYKVKKLDRVYYAGLTKKNLPRGKWRFLNDKEIAMLKRGTYK
ncbi:MAG: rRNA pseudouridine synthase [Salinivirgaceae bacterium]|nr:rRNA pseudouridine synthase [Salinivirgaceae bacterium]